MTIRDIEVLADHSAETPWDQGFFRLRRLQLRNHYSDASESRPYACDVLERRGVDAVAVFLFRLVEGEPRVLFRECIRPAVFLRRGRAHATPDPQPYPVLVEAIAGVLEPGDEAPGGIASRASIEAHEEAGVSIDPRTMVVLGHGAFDAPGVMAEKVFFVAGEYDPAQRGRPQTDGSPFEERGEVFELSLSEAFARIANGSLCDMKTELGLRRLQDWFRAGRP
jgi:8-oxo-dGTP pyrophosphatase MutT (NUDIX family)